MIIAEFLDIKKTGVNACLETYNVPGRGIRYIIEVGDLERFSAGIQRHYLCLIKNNGIVFTGICFYVIEQFNAVGCVRSFHNHCFIKNNALVSGM